MIPQSLGTPQPLDVVEVPARHRYELDVGGLTAFVTYRRGPDGTVSLLHTEVPREIEGQGVASTLVRGALDIIRTKAELVLPFCPFVHSYIRRHTQYVDLVAARYPRLDSLTP